MVSFSALTLLLPLSAGDHWLLNQPLPPVPVAPLAPSTHTPWPCAGAPCVVVVWAAYCGPCVQELEHLSHTLRQRADHPWIRLVSVDPTESAASRRLARLRLSHEQVETVWAGPKASGEWGIPTVPTTLVVDSAGMVRQVSTHPRDRDGWNALLDDVSAMSEPSPPAPIP